MIKMAVVVILDGQGRFVVEAAAGYRYAIWCSERCRRNVPSMPACITLQFSPDRLVEIASTRMPEQYGDFAPTGLERLLNQVGWACA